VLSSARVVVAEGRDGADLVRAVARAMGLHDVQVCSFEGVDTLTGHLKALPGVAGFEAVRALGIVCDAEDDATARCQSAANALGAAKLPVPAAPLAPAPGSPRVVMPVNPHGARAGRLEDVGLAALQGHPAMPWLDAYFDCLARAGLPSPRRLAKAGGRTASAATFRSTRRHSTRSVPCSPASDPVAASPDP